jgi:hypothetical protein
MFLLIMLVVLIIVFAAISDPIRYFLTYSVSDDSRLDAWKRVQDKNLGTKQKSIAPHYCNCCHHVNHVNEKE